MVIELPILNMKGFSLSQVVKTILTGGQGSGSYYTVVMIQIIILYPVIYWLIQKRGGVLITIFTNLLFEIVDAVTDMNPNIYRLVSFRYLTFLVIGAWYARNKLVISESKKNVLRWSCLFLGILLVYVMNYCGIELWLFKQWTVTAMPVVILSFSYYLFAEQYLKKKNRWVELISKGSFHIYLVQMVYYTSLGGVIHKYIRLPNEICYFIINVFICILVGILFYNIEKVGRNWCKKNILKR